MLSMLIFTWTENQNSRKDLITETLLECPSGGQQNTDTQKSGELSVQAGEEEKEAAMKMHLVWNTHSSKWGRRAEGYPGMGNSANSAEGTATPGTGMCAQGTDGTTALRSRDSYLYWTHVELKKFTLIKKVCPLLPSSHLSRESPL